MISRSIVSLLIIALLIVGLKSGHIWAADPVTDADWIRCLKSDPSPMQRANAAAQLGVSERATEEVIVALIDAINDRDVADRNLPFIQGHWRTVSGEAIDALQKIGKPAVPLLIERYSDQDYGGRLTYLNLLTRIGPDADSAVPLVVGALSDKFKLIRYRALGALGVLTRKNEAALPHFIAALADPSADVRSVALCELRTWQPPPRHALTEIRKLLHDPSDREEAISNHFSVFILLRCDAIRAIAAIAEAGDESLVVLRTLMTDSFNVQVQTSAAVAVVQLDPSHDDAVDHLIQLLDCEEEECLGRVIAAADSLGEIGRSGERAFTKIAALIKHSAAGVCGTAGVAAARIDPQQAEPLLLPLLKAEDTVSYGIEAMSHIPVLNKASIQGLIDVLRPERDFFLGFWKMEVAIKLLVRCGKRATDAIPVLQKIVDDEDEWPPTREVARQAIVTIQSAM